MRCIYCLETSDGAKGLAHVIPETIAANGLTLPRGTVCDSCNSYLGHELDAVMSTHPVLALIIQFLRLPGKGGYVRKRLGNVASDIHPRGITIPCYKPRRVQGPDGHWESIVEPLVDPSFDFRRFRRALHHVAFNALALRDGVGRALEAVYDPVRRYIRQPLKNESWAFVQYVNLSSGLARDATVIVLRDATTEYGILLVAKAAAFGVDLRRAGSLETMASAQFPVGTTVIAANEHFPRTPKQKGPRRYRITIELDN